MLTSAAVDANVNNTGADSATFKINNAKLYVLTVTLSADDNAKLSKLLGKGFKRFIYWNKLNKVAEISANNGEKYIRELLHSSCQEVKKLFVLAYDNATGNNQVFTDSFKKDLIRRNQKNINRTR